MADVIDKTTVAASDVNGHNKADTLVNATEMTTIKEDEHSAECPPVTPGLESTTGTCEALREQNDTLRQELHDIRREMDEITDQFRTEDAEEFKQLQAELEVAAKNCRILQFKLRKAEKRNESVEAEKLLLEEKLHRSSRDNNRARDLDEELLIAKEVSVRLHGELEKSEESRMIMEKLNFALKQHLDTLKDSFDQRLQRETYDDYHTWQLSVGLYESLFREYILMEELTWSNAEKNARHARGTSALARLSMDTNNNGDVSDLMNSYQQKIACLNEEILQLKHDVQSRDQDICQLHVQCKILKQRSRSAERTSNSTNGPSSPNDDATKESRLRRGISVDAGGNLREQLDTSVEETRALKAKLSKLEDELNSSVLDKQTLLVKLDEHVNKGTDDAFNDNLHVLAKSIDTLIHSMKESKIDEKIVNELQPLLRTSRWSKQIADEQTQSKVLKTNQQTSEIVQHANELLTLLQAKHEVLDKIRYRLSNLTYDTTDACTLLDELDTTKHDLERKQDHCQQLQATVAEIQLASKVADEQRQQQADLNRALQAKLDELQEENSRLSTVNAKQTQDLRHVEQLRQSILIFEKKLDQKQTRVNELSMKVIEKEDIIETKVKECQKHRLELRELETKYYTLGKQLEGQIFEMTKEIEKLNVEKEMLKFDLESIRLHQQNDRPKSVSAEDEIARVKAECRQQIIDGEMESVKLRLNQSNHEKDELLKMIKEFEKKYRELQIKSDTDEQSWLRMKTDMSEKQRKYDESIKLKVELQNAVDRLRQKLHDLETHGQEKQNKFTFDKQQGEIQRIELIGKVNELEEQLSKVTKRQRKDLETAWKKERNELQKQLLHSQQFIKDLQKQSSLREAPIHLTEKINILLTENELLLNKIKELESVVDNVQTLRAEVQRLRDKNSSDWNYWRKQQSDLYAQLRQQHNIKESILLKFDRLQRQIKSADAGPHQRLVRDISVGPLSINSFQNDGTTKTSLSNYSRETLADETDLPHGTIDGGAAGAHEIVGTMDDFTSLPTAIIDHDKQRMFDKTYSAQESTAASIEEIASKLDRVEDHLFSYRRFMDFIRAKSEKSSSIVRDDSFTNIVNSSHASLAHKRLASAPPENNYGKPPPTTTTTTTSSSAAAQRRSRFDDKTNSSQEYLPNLHDNLGTDLMSNSMTATSTSAAAAANMVSSKNRFFSLSRRFRFRVQSPEKGTLTPPTPASVHFLDEDIDLETKEPTARKSEQNANRPSKGILKSLRHRSPFRFRSKDAAIPEQEPSPPPTPSPTPEPPKDTRTKASQPIPPTAAQPKTRGRLVELKKPTAKPPTSNGAPRKGVTVPVPPEPTASTLVRRASGLKDLIHRFEATPSDKPAKPKRVTMDIHMSQSSSTESSGDDPVKKSTSYSDLPMDDQHRLSASNKSKTIDIPDLLRNVEKEPSSSSTPTKAILRHSNSGRQTTSFDSTVSMVSASESILTTNSTSGRKPTSTARPLMLSFSKDES